MKFDPRSFRGPIDVNIQLETDDPVHSTVSIHLLAFVELLFGVEPEFITFGQINKKDTPVTRQAKLIGFKLPELTITRVESSNPMFGVTLSPPNEAGISPAIDITLNKEAPLGAQQARVTVITDNPEFQTQFSVTAVVRGNTRVQPQRVVFRIKPGQAVVKQKVRIQNMSAENFTVEKVEILEDVFPPLLAERPAEEEDITYIKPSPQDLDIAIVPHKNNGIVDLELTLKRTLQPKERLQGQFRVTTNDSEDKTIDVHYFVFTQEPGKTAGDTKKE